jgi:hypothetical protein
MLENRTKRFFLFLSFYGVGGFDGPAGLFISMDRAILGTIDRPFRFGS